MPATIDRRFLRILGRTAAAVTDVKGFLECPAMGGTPSDQAHAHTVVWHVGNRLHQAPSQDGAWQRVYHSGYGFHDQMGLGPSGGQYRGATDNRISLPKDLFTVWVATLPSL